MKIIEVVELNENSVKIGEEKNPLAMRYFDDNGGLPSGNYDENDISGIWVHLEGKHTNFAKYAYRSIDNSTMIPGCIFKNYLINEMIGKKVIVDAEWLKENDPETLSYIMDSEYCDFAEEETVLEIQFDEGGTRSYACSESATCDIPSQNQPPWWDGSWGDWKIEDIQLYYKKLK